MKRLKPIRVHNQRLKLFKEDFTQNEYYKQLYFDEDSYKWVGGFTSDKHPSWDFNKNDVRKLCSYFKDWDIYIKPSFKKDKYELFILSKGTSLIWFCPDPKERKKLTNISHRNIQEFNISDIIITGRTIKAFQINDYQDEYYTCSINDHWGNIEECFECDQIDGLLKLLEDKGII